MRGFSNGATPRNRRDSEIPFPFGERDDRTCEDTSLPLRSFVASDLFRLIPVCCYEKVNVYPKLSSYQFILYRFCNWAHYYFDRNVNWGYPRLRYLYLYITQRVEKFANILILNFNLLPPNCDLIVVGDKRIKGLSRIHTNKNHCAAYRIILYSNSKTPSSVSLHIFVQKIHAYAI